MLKAGTEWEEHGPSKNYLHGDHGQSRCRADGGYSALLMCGFSGTGGEASAWAALQEEINQAENGGVITLSQEKLARVR